MFPLRVKEIREVDKNKEVKNVEENDSKIRRAG